MLVILPPLLSWPETNISLVTLTNPPTHSRTLTCNPSRSPSVDQYRYLDPPRPAQNQTALSKSLPSLVISPAPAVLPQEAHSQAPPTRSTTRTTTGKLASCSPMAPVRTMQATTPIQAMKTQSTSESMRISPSPIPHRVRLTQVVAYDVPF